MLKDIAQQYLNRGWNVVPLKSKSKEPSLNSWKDLQTRRLTSSDLSNLFNDETQNIGIITGSISNLVVVDADGPEGLASLQALSLSSPVTALTGKGKHLYFSATTEKINNAVRIIPGIDIRGEGGYVCAPPSVHESTKRYRWLNELFWRRGIPLPRFPTEKLFANTPCVKEDKKPDSWIAKALEGMKLGNIDDTLVSILGRLRHDGYSREDARALLLLPALQAGAVDGHLEEKIVNVWSRYEAKKSIAVENEEVESAEELFKIDEEVEWIVPGLVAKNSIGLVVGLPESHKTWVVMDLAIAAATGGDWLGLFPVKRVKTLFVEQERDRKETKRRFKRLINYKGSPNLDNLHFKLGSSIKVNLDNSYEGLVRLLEKETPELVIIDSFGTFHTKSLKDDQEMRAVMERVKKLRSQFNCTFLFVHHDNKLAFLAAQEGREPGMNEMLGSIMIPAAAETMFTVQKTKGGGSIIYHSKSTLATKSPQFSVLVEDVQNGIQVRGVK